jgi:hypothetical protein
MFFNYISNSGPERGNLNSYLFMLILMRMRMLMVWFLHLLLNLLRLFNKLLLRNVWLLVFLITLRAIIITLSTMTTF